MGVMSKDYEFDVRLNEILNILPVVGWRNNDDIRLDLEAGTHKTAGAFIAAVWWKNCNISPFLSISCEKN